MRNTNIEAATLLILSKIDDLIAGDSLSSVIPRNIQFIFDNHLKSHGGSVRLACVFLVAYCLQDSSWDFQSIPIGIRGKYGDKKLASGLTRRHITFHKNITAFGENLGWKGNVRNFDLKSDSRFKDFILALQNLRQNQRQQLFEHICWRLFESRQVPQALPPLPKGYLSYSRALRLCEILLTLPSEGHIPQFLIASFLFIHRKRFGHQIKTHHPHASDKFDGTCGDIEEFRDTTLISAYEVTVRDDWKNRLPDFQQKMQRGHLSRYIIFASNVNQDDELYPAEKLISFTENLTFDLAIVDIREFCSIFCAELSRDEILEVINHTYESLLNPVLCGREDFAKAYLDSIQLWGESLKLG